MNHNRDVTGLTDNLIEILNYLCVVSRCTISDFLYIGKYGVYTRGKR